MEFTWRHIILLAEKMFRYTDADVAEHLDVNRSTINRHRQEGYNRRFRVCVNVYKELFEPPDSKPETLNDQLSKLKETLNEDDFPDSVRNLEFGYEQYIKHLLKLAEKAECAGKSTQPPELDLSDCGEQSINDLTNSAVKKVRSVWNPELSYMPEDFYKYLKEYTIGDIINLDPMELIGINYMFSENKPDGEEIIRNSVQFVKAVEDAMQRAEISSFNEKTCKAISAFVKSLREYIDFLMENANDPEFRIKPFTLSPIDTVDFKSKAVYHNRKLRAILRQIVNIQERINSEFDAWHAYRPDRL